MQGDVGLNHGLLGGVIHLTPHVVDGQTSTQWLSPCLDCDRIVGISTPRRASAPRPHPEEDPEKASGSVSVPLSTNATMTNRATASMRTLPVAKRRMAIKSRLRTQISSPFTTCPCQWEMRNFAIKKPHQRGAFCISGAFLKHCHLQIWLIVLGAVFIWASSLS